MNTYRLMISLFIRWTGGVFATGFLVLIVHMPVSAAPQPLTPVLEAHPTSGQAPLTVMISGSKSTGKWGGNEHMDAWEFDPDYDGVSFDPVIFDPVFDYTYDQPGTYTCRMRIADTPNTPPPREAFANVTVTVSASTRDTGVRSKFPPNAWGAGISHVWADDGQQAAAADHLAPMNQIYLQWDHVEPERHRSYDWTDLDRELRATADLGQCASVQINSSLPDWVFDHIAKTGTARDMPSPQFWDPDYIQYYRELITALASHIASSPHKGQVLYVRQQWNAIHTETCFYGQTVEGNAKGTWTDNPNWAWPADGHRHEVEWTEDIALDYQRQIQRHFISEFRPLSIGVAMRVIENPLPEGEVHGHFTNDSMTEWVLQTNNTATDWDHNGISHTPQFLYMRCFGALGYEETWGVGNTRLAQVNPELSRQRDIYGVVLRALAVGVPYIGIKGDDLEHVASDVECQEALNFGNKYAGWHLHPRSAPGAWIVLGEFRGSTQWRWCNTLTSQNWGYFMRQNNPAGTSTPLSLVGDSSCRFGIWARQLDAKATFDLDDSFSQAIRYEPVEVRVTYKENSGAISVQADRNGTLETLTEDRHEDHKGWRTAVFPIEPPRFADGPDGETDIAIIPTSGSPVVHLIEIDRFSSAPQSVSGDMNNDGQLNLKDAIFGLQLLSGFASSQFANKDADINADRRIGMEEIVFVLQKISGVYADATVEILTAIGTPTYYTPGQDTGYYLWQDTDDSEWHIRWSGNDAKRYDYKGTIRSDAAFGNAAPYGFEDNDDLQIGTSVIRFTGYTTSGEDGIDFHAFPGTGVSFDLHVDETQDPKGVHIGASGTNPSQIPFTLMTAEDLPAIDPPTYTFGQDAGYYLWQDADDSEWHLRWSGDGAKTYGYTGTVTSSSDFANADAYSFEDNDELQTDGSVIRFTGYTSSGEDGISFHTSAGAGISFDLHVDETRVPQMVHIGQSGASPGQVPFILMGQGEKKRKKRGF